MPIIVRQTPTELRGLAQQAGRGQRIEREQDIFLSNQQNERANQALELQRRQQDFNQALASRQQLAREQQFGFANEVADREFEFDLQRFDNEIRRQDEQDQLAREALERTFQETQDEIQRELEKEERDRQSGLELENTRSLNRMNETMLRDELQQRAAQRMIDREDEDRQRLIREGDREFQALDDLGVIPDRLRPFVNSQFGRTLGSKAARQVVNDLSQMIANGTPEQQIARALSAATGSGIDKKIDSLSVLLKQMPEDGVLGGTTRTKADVAWELSDWHTLKGLQKPDDLNMTMEQYDALRGQTGGIGSLKVKFNEIATNDAIRSRKRDLIDQARRSGALKPILPGKDTEAVATQQEFTTLMDQINNEAIQWANDNQDIIARSAIRLAEGAGWVVEIRQ